MKKSADAFGQALSDYAAGVQSTSVVFERDDGFIDCSSPGLSFTPFRAWPAMEQDALGFAEGRVLDIGCGAGRHALYLQERGHDVVAIDSSPLAVRVCRQRGVRHARVLAISRIGRSLGVFDTMLMLGSNFGLFGNPAGASRMLKRMHATTNDAARIIAGSRDPRYGGGPEHRAYHARHRKRGRPAGQLRMRVRTKLAASPWFGLLLVSPREMERIVGGTGRRVREAIGSGDSPNYVAILEKDRT